MGTDRAQPLTLICNYPNARLYTQRVDLSDLNVLDVEVGLEWALLQSRYLIKKLTSRWG